MNKYILFTVVMLGALASSAYAHEGHNDIDALTGNTAVSNAPLVLSAESIGNIGIETKPAELKPLPDTLTMPATVALIPERQAQVTTRFEGRVQEIKVKLGQEVQKGQDLIVVEPVQIGTNIITFKAPMSGRVMQQNVVPGQSVTFQTSLLDIADTSKILIKGAIYETPELARLAVGQNVRASIGIYPDRIFEGVIEKIDVGPAVESRTLHVYALFDNADGALKPNLRGTLSVILDDGGKPSVVVPASAVLENNGVSFVFVREDKRFERREIEVGRKTSNEIEIISGVFPDEQVVTQGNYQLQYLRPEAPPKKEEH